MPSHLSIGERQLHNLPFPTSLTLGGAMMQSEKEKAYRWESGCQTDPMRNKFLIPNLIRILDAAQPARILDIGAGTGYIPRITDGKLSYRASWTLIDINSARLQIAKEMQSDEMLSTNIVADVGSYQFDGQFDCVLATFTLLEILDVDGLIDRLPHLLRDDGHLLLSLPDTWRDVLEQGRDEPKVVEEFLAGCTSLPKIDKFTDDVYPFRAVRIEHLISRVLASGFELTELTESESDHAGVYLLAFRRRGTLS
jgi:SAM-dependent methyltransferase